MIEVPALLFLFLLQFILLSTGLAIFFLIRQKKYNTKTTISQGEIRRLEGEIEEQKEEIKGLLSWPQKFSELQKRLVEIQGINAKLKETVELLVPEAQRSKEFEQLVADIHQHNNDLNTCIGTLQSENELLNQRVRSSDRETDSLSRKLQNSVKKEDYQHIVSEKKSLEIKIEKLREELDKKTKDYDKLEKNYIYLEKEYNSLYKNIKGEEP